MPDFTDPTTLNAFIAAGAISVACAILSVFVVARRWAFLAEGISHSGFGGAGTAWMLAALYPQTFDGPTMPYVFVLVFCFLAAVAIGWLTASNRVTSDAAVGIFLVASLAWGFIGQHLYVERLGRQPFGFENLLFGQMKQITSVYTIAAVGVAGAVILATWSLSKELIAYCFDPLLARTSGVRSGFVHYLLMAMMALAIVIGIRVVGSVLMTALLVLPAATANLLTKKLNGVIVLSIAIALIGAWGGLLISNHWRWLPAGLAIVLLMFVQFVVAMAARRNA